MNYPKTNKYKIGKFIRLNMPGICRFYYTTFCKREMVDVLMIMKDAGCLTDKEIVNKCMQKYGWSELKSLLQFGRCVFCGYIGHN